MPEGSSSAAPVIRPGPSWRAHSRIFFMSASRRGAPTGAGRVYNAGNGAKMKKSPGSSPGLFSQLTSSKRGLARLEVRLDVTILVIAQEDQADDEGHDRHDDRIPESVVDVAFCGHHRGREQWQHAAEPAVADVVWQRHGRISDVSREKLD